MNGVSLPSLLPAIVLSGVAAVELFFRLPFLAQIEAINGGAMKALDVVRSRRISDHWKERVLPAYAGRILRASLLLGVLLASCAALFALVWTLAAWVPGGGPGPALEQLARPLVQVVVLAVCIVWALLRGRLFRAGETEPSDYSASSRMLHRLALGSDGMRSLCDDIDRRVAGARAEAVVVDRPVYVASLARAGTTVLLEALHGSGAFASLTYRSMPFVMAPWTWGAVSRPRRARAADLRERAHGDRLLVSVDSPEAFEEVFWSTYARRATRDVDGLRPAGEPDPAVLERYRSWVRRILARGGARSGGRRYLCKNNNHVLRIEWLFAAFPDALVLTPFRDPADHVQSLLRQHRRFLERHREDPFSLEYMDWLGHHEFGRHFLPFKVASGVVPADPQALLQPAYWVSYWTAVYRYLLDRHGERLLWFDYERFCDEPAAVLAELEAALGLSRGALAGFARKVSRSPRTPEAAVRRAITPECRELFEALRERASAERVPGLAG